MTQAPLKNVIKFYSENAPEAPGIYKMFDINKKIIYIGKAKNIKNRLKQYINDLHGKTLIMVGLVHHVEYNVTETESAALLMEAGLIKKFKPKFNILLKDDKSFPYIKLRLDHEFPQLLKYRGRDFKDGKFFGPFVSVKHVETTLGTLQKIFKLRSCSDGYFAIRKRPCLQYQINRCSAPCVGKISKDDYLDVVSEVETFLSGKNKSLQESLAKKMQILSDDLKFEEAALVRDRIKALSYIQLKAETSGITEDTDIIAIASLNGEYCVMLYVYRGGQACGNYPYFPEHTDGVDIQEVLEAFLPQLYHNNIPALNVILSHKISNSDIFSKAFNVKISVPKSGIKLNLVQIAVENAKIALEQKIKNSAKNLDALREVQKLFDLPSIPNRIEVYDNSHIQGSAAVGAMIVGGMEGFDKKEYRLFNIKELSNDGDDYAMLGEVLRRRFARLKSEPNKRPDLIIIDGGRGHMGIVKNILKKFDLDIPFVCMSKGVHRNSGMEQFHRPNHDVFTLDRNLPVMKYLQILRDEVHNFAIKNHRKKRSRAIRISSLDNISGIGATRKKLLLNYFGSFKAVTDATIDELTKIDGISRELAKNIYEQLKLK